MEIAYKLINLLPQFDEIKEILKSNPEGEYILKKTFETFNGIQKQKPSTSDSDDGVEECYFLVQALLDKFWEVIHTGHFSEVPLDVRKTYALASYCKVSFSGH